jgi:hypothetical protein
MPTFALDAALQVELRQPSDGGDNIVHVPFSFTTNGSGVPTLGYSYDGALSIIRATNSYTLDLGGPFNSLLAARANLGTVAATVNWSETLGQVTLAYVSALNNAVIHGVIIVDIGQR